MPSHEDHRGQRWLHKALCRRYAFVHVAEFSVSGMENGVARHQSWCWAFAMFAADEFEILGAWPVGADAPGPIMEDLRNRGVLSIRVASIAEAMGSTGSASGEPWATALRDAEPRVLAVLASKANSEDAIQGVPAEVIRSALNMAGRIHHSLVRAIRSRAPFPSADAATEFVAGWLQKADRRLYEVQRPTKPVLAHAA